MKVRELINDLSKVDPEAEVLIVDDEDIFGALKIKAVEVSKEDYGEVYIVVGE